MSAIDNLNAVIDRVSKDVQEILAVFQAPSTDEQIGVAITRLAGVADALEAVKAPAAPMPEPAPAPAVEPAPPTTG